MICNTPTASGINHIPLTIWTPLLVPPKSPSPKHRIHDRIHLFLSSFTPPSLLPARSLSRLRSSITIPLSLLSNAQSYDTWFWPVEGLRTPVFSSSNANHFLIKFVSPFIYSSLTATPIRVYHNITFFSRKCMAGEISQVYLWYFFPLIIVS